MDLRIEFTEVSTWCSICGEKLNPGLDKYLEHQVIHEEKERKMEFPFCKRCQLDPPAKLVPLSDYGMDGASVTYKAWVCTNPSCDFALRIDKGEISRGYKLDKR